MRYPRPEPAYPPRSKWPAPLESGRRNLPKPDRRSPWTCPPPGRDAGPRWHRGPCAPLPSDTHSPIWSSKRMGLPQLLQLSVFNRFSRTELLRPRSRQLGHRSRQRQTQQDAKNGRKPNIPIQLDSSKSQGLPPTVRRHHPKPSMPRKVPVKPQKIRACFRFSLSMGPPPILYLIIDKGFPSVDAATDAAPAGPHWRRNAPLPLEHRSSFLQRDVPMQRRAHRRFSALTARISSSSLTSKSSAPRRPCPAFHR